MQLTTFLFMVTPETERVLVERVTHELAERFPEFVAGGADISEFENSILAVHSSTDNDDEPNLGQVPDKLEVQRVKDAFVVIPACVQDWKSS